MKRDGKTQGGADDFSRWSQEVEYLGAAPQSAKTLADGGDPAKAAEHLIPIVRATGERLRSVTHGLDEYKHLLAGLGAEPGDTVTLADVMAPSAHEAVITHVQRWYFALWSEVDFAGWLGAQTGQNVLFDPQSIASAPEKAVAYCRGLPAVDAAGVLARLQRERALVGAKLQTLGGGSHEMPADLDMSAYTSAVNLWKNRFETYKKFRVWLNGRPEIRRYSRGRRLYVHAGDWHKYWGKQDAAVFDALDADPAEKISELLAGAAERQSEIRARKQTKGE